MGVVEGPTCVCVCVCMCVCLMNWAAARVTWGLWADGLVS